MTRKEISAAVHRLNAALQESRLMELFHKLVEHEQTPRDNISSELMSELMESYRVYSLKAASFGDVELAVIKIFELEPLADTTFWTRLLSPDARGGQPVYEIFTTVRFGLKNMPKIVNLYEQTTLRDFRASKDKPDSHFAGRETLSCILIESEDSFSAPRRLVEALESVDLLYLSCGEVLGLPNNDLSVIACDSGSDKTFDFLGGAKIMESVKELVLALWDRVVFYRERQLSQHVQLIAESLPIIDKIGEMEQEKKLEPEKAAILRRQVIDGASKFLASGMTIPEIQASTTHNPRVGVCTSLPTTPHLVVGRSACRVGVGPSLNRSWAQRSRPVVQAGRRAFPGDESVVD